MSYRSGDALAAIVRRLRSDWWLVTIDAGVFVFAWVGALLLRYDAHVPDWAWDRLSLFLPFALMASLGANGVAGLYSGVARHASLDEVRRIAAAQLGVALLLLPTVVLLDRPVPASVPLIASGLSLGMVGLLRFRARLFTWRRPRARETERVVVLGAGSAGAGLVHDIRQWRAGTRVVAFLDDNPGLWGRRIHNVPVRGKIDDLPRVAAMLHADYAILAVPSAPPDLLRRIEPLAERSGVVLRVVPPLGELVSGRIRLTDVRDIQIGDLLRRGEVDTDLAEVTSLVAGKRVLITGGGGSIGSEIARQVSQLGARRVVLLDHDETHLFDTAATVPNAVQRLCDIREPAAVEQVFRRECPDLVFHAAAHKHVPLLEDHAVEAAKTNVVGTRNVLAAAQAAGVSRFVLISTDKAVRPSSVMGATKAAAEKVTLTEPGPTVCCAVRFGNVLGSRGSVVPTFLQQIQGGGPVTVTDGRMTRYFMSIPEAVRLVLHAAAMSRGGEIFMLDMGQPVSILDLACRMIRLSGRRPGTDVEVRVTGMRPGEKLAEQLQNPEESKQPTAHPSVLRLTPMPVSQQSLARLLHELSAAVTQRNDEKARSVLTALVKLPELAARIPAQKVSWENAKEASTA